MVVTCGFWLWRIHNGQKLFDIPMLMKQKSRKHRANLWFFKSKIPWYYLFKPYFWGCDKYIRGFTSWTPAVSIRSASDGQVYQGIYELNPSTINEPYNWLPSISGDLRVEPQHTTTATRFSSKYIRGFTSWTPAQLVAYIRSEQVYQEIYELNPNV